MSLLLIYDLYCYSHAEMRHLHVMLMIDVLLCIVVVSGLLSLGCLNSCSLLRIGIGIIGGLGCVGGIVRSSGLLIPGCLFCSSTVGLPLATMNNCSYYYFESYANFDSLLLILMQFGFELPEVRNYVDVDTHSFFCLSDIDVIFDFIMHSRFIYSDSAFITLYENDLQLTNIMKPNMLLKILDNKRI